jgi:hypothetical protein
LFFGNFFEEKERPMSDPQIDPSKSDSAAPVGPSAQRRGVVGEFWDY